MLHSAKQEEWICPECGSDDCTVDDYDWECDSICRKMYCNACEHTWHEYFIVSYDGYSDKTGEYDAQGVCITAFEDHTDDQDNDDAE